MEYKFTRSVVVMGQLAKESSRTPPSEENSPFEYVDRSLTILGRTSDVHSERMRKEFLSQREFIANQIKEVDKKLEDAKEEMNGRFNKVHKKFEDLEEKMDERFNKVDKKFEDLEEKMNERFKKVDKKFEDLEEKMNERFKKVDKKIDGVNNNMRDYLNHMQKASRNSLRIRGWEEIYPVGSLDSYGGIQTPDYFPRNVRHFWRLKDPTQIDQLVYLIRFYKIQGYEEWGRDADSFKGYSDSNDSSEGTSESSRSPVLISLEEAVRSNPEIAHRALGAQLGLAYDEIQRFMERAKELSQGQVIGNKRGPDDQASEEKKKRGFNLSDLTEVTSPTEPRSSQGRTG
ncbi:MAG: hypothetical protein M1835_003305 [Candelina submexicana]|nr:MAG: hypothetical protein M1835_003305 [Candelina submexicana]